MIVDYLTQSYLWVWGGGKYGKLGLGDEDNRPVPAEVPFFATNKTRELVTACCGLHHTVAITYHRQDAVSQVFAWGYSAQFRCGVDDRGLGFFPKPREIDFFSNKPLGKTNRAKGEVVSQNLFGTPRAVSVSAGTAHNLALAHYENSNENEYHVYAWGDNTYGQLGTGFHKPSVKPIPVPGFPPGKKVTAVACGGRHSLAIVSGSVFAWGCNGEW